MNSFTNMIKANGNSMFRISFSDGEHMKMKPPITLTPTGDSAYIMSFHNGDTGIKESRKVASINGIANYYDRKGKPFGIITLQKIKVDNTPEKCRTIGEPEVFQHEFYSNDCKTVNKNICTMSVTCKNDPQFGSIDIAVANCAATPDGRCPDLYTCARDQNYKKGIPVGENNMELFKSHPAKDGDYLQLCLNNLPEGKIKKISDKVSYTCNIKKNIGGSSNRKYTLKKVNGQMVISTSIYFNYLGAAGQKADRFKKAQSAKKCMKDFFRRHGLVLDITFKGEKDSHNKHDCDHTVNLHDNMDREDAKNWATLSRGGRTLTSDERCGTYIHELLHNFGLPDTYPDPKHCPDRDTIHDRDSIMACFDCKNAKIYDEHLKMLLWPICSRVM